MFWIFDVMCESWIAGSECNCSMLTFDGVDVMGERLAEEVCSFNVCLA